MDSSQFVLQRILIPTDKRYDSCPGLFYRYGELSIGYPQSTNFNSIDSTPLPVQFFDGWGIDIDRSNGRMRIAAGTTVSFATYFNMLPIKKWTTYTFAERITLQLDAHGTFDLVIKALDADDIPHWFYNRHSARQAELAQQRIQADGSVVVDIPPEAEVATAVAFEIHAIDDVVLAGGAWIGDIGTQEPNRVDIGLLTTTFQKEEFITANLAMLEQEVFAVEDDLANHLHVFVVDNGRTLDASNVESEHVKLFPNPNVGGAGGFARGMIEALRSDIALTHVLIMDDDVHIMPDSLQRTYMLLRLLKPEYAGRYISGAMLCDEAMNIQHEDIGAVNPGGFFASKKGDRDLYDARSMVANDAFWGDYDDEYAAWWYCVVPMQYVTEKTLPMPLFVRGDDVEFSLRNEPGFLTMSGICVWHVGFSQKYSAAMECYQVIRNSLILQAAAGVTQKSIMYERSMDQVMYMLYQYAYDYAELVLDAIEDYMKGPEFLEHADGAKIIKEKSALNEVLKPIEEYASLLHEAGLDGPRGLYAVREDEPLSRFWAFLRWRTMNGHRKAPKFFFRRKIGTTPYDWQWTLNKQTGSEAILAVHPVLNQAILRERDTQRFEELYARKEALEAEYKMRGDEIAKQWRDRYPYLTSIEFWVDHLGIN